MGSYKNWAFALKRYPLRITPYRFQIQFGFGKVTELDLKSPDKKAKIIFDKAGEKTLLLSFAKLRIVS